METAGQSAPFVVRSAGLGLFTGLAPVLYLAVVKTDNLMKVHRS